MDVFSLIGKISIEYANADKALTEINSKSDHAANSLKKMDSFSESLSKGLNKLGDVCGKVGKALAPLSARVRPSFSLLCAASRRCSTSSRAYLFRGPFPGL